MAYPLPVFHFNVDWGGATNYSGALEEDARLTAMSWTFR